MHSSDDRAQPKINKYKRKHCGLCKCLSIFQNRLRWSQVCLTPKHRLIPLQPLESRPLTGLPCSSVGKESDCNAGDPGSIPVSGGSTGEGKGYPLQYSWAFLVAQLVKNRLQCRRPGFDPWVGKIPLEKGKAEQVPTDLLSRTQLNDFHFTSLSPLTTFLVKEEGERKSGWAGGQSWGCLASTETCTTLDPQAMVIGGLFNLSLYLIIWKRTSKSEEVMGFGYRKSQVPASALSPTCCLAPSERLPSSKPRFCQQ